MTQTNRSSYQKAGQQGDSFVTKKELSDALQVTEKKLSDAFSDALQVFRQELRDERNYETGKYYRSLNVIWDNNSLKFEGAAEEWGKFRSKDTHALAYYRQKKGNRYYSDEFPLDRLFPGGFKSMAHLIPNDPSCSLAWLRALSIVTGIGVSNSESPLLYKELRSFVEGDVEVPLQSGGANGPLKAWAWNFLMLPEDHEKHFDKIVRNNDEQVIISPIWDPEKKRWSPGTGYKLMVAASPETYKWLLGTENLDESVQNKWFGVASPGEQEEATNFLALTVRALADLLVTHCEGDLTKLVEEQREANVKRKGEQRDANVNRKGGDTTLEGVFKSILSAIPGDLLSQRSYHTNTSASNSESSKQPDYRNKAQAFAKKIKAIENVRNKNLVTGVVQIPVLLKESKKPILVIDLGVYFKGNEHLIPDPFLVALKAAVSWSNFRDQKLLPACGKHPDHQLGSDARKEESIPFEIFSTAEEDTASGDDDSVLSISEVLTGSPGDRNFEAVSTVSPCGKTTVKCSVVTP